MNLWRVTSDIGVNLSSSLIGWIEKHHYHSLVFDISSDSMVWNKQNVFPIIFLIMIAGMLMIVLLTVIKVHAKRERSFTNKEILFQNIFSNLDVSFLLYNPADHSASIVSENLQSSFGIAPQTIYENPGAIFDYC